MASKHIKDVWCHQSLENCKWKQQWDASSHLLGWLPTKKRKLACVDKDVGKLEPSCIAGWAVKWKPLWKSSVILQKVKRKITMWSSSSIPMYIPQKTEKKDSTRYWYTSIHSSIVHNSQKMETTQVHWQMNEWRECGVYIWWNTIWQWKGVAF